MEAETDEAWDTALKEHGVVTRRREADTDDEGEGNEGGAAGRSGDTGQAKPRNGDSGEAGRQDAILLHFYELLDDTRVEGATLHALLIRLVTGLEPAAAGVAYLERQ